jgi:hypothetical protein
MPNFQKSCLVALSLAALAVTAQAASIGQGKKVLFVLQEKTKPDNIATDAKVRQHLEALGFSVQVVDQAAPASVATGADLVVISSTVSAQVIEGKYKAISAPIVTWESYILPHMGLTGRKLDADFGTQKEKIRYIDVVNAPHPLAAGLPAGMLNVFKEGGVVNWGKPGLGATIISTVAGDPARVTEFAYEKGATMESGTAAPARRVSLFLENTSFTELNEAGLKLFDAALRWGLGNS